jgi:diguanylate cyclase (GGDEF)-like protein
MKDGPALLIELALVSAMLGIVLWIAWRSFGRAAHALTWAISYGIGAVCYSFNAVDTFSGRRNLSHFMLLSSITLVLNYMWVRGYRQRAGLPPHQGVFFTAIALASAGLYFFNYGIHYFNLMLAINPLFMAVMLFLSASAALQDKDGWKRRANAAERATAIVLLLFGCLELTMMVAALRVGRPTPNAAALLLYNEILILGLPSFYIGNGIISVLLIAADLAGRMEVLARTDTLTGLLNRRGFEREAQAAIAAARSRNGQLAAVLADLDHFKKINDRHGHGIGDVVLQRFSGHLRSALPANCSLGRLGGEEFVFLIPDTSEAATMELVESLRVAVTTLSLAEFEVAPLTSSFGITFLEADDTSLIDLLARADVALYQAKATGRNRTVLFDPSLKPLHVPRAERPIPA